MPILFQFTKLDNAIITKEFPLTPTGKHLNDFNQPVKQFICENEENEQKKMPWLINKLIVWLTFSQETKKNSPISLDISQRLNENLAKTLTEIVAVQARRPKIQLNHIKL